MSPESPKPLRFEDPAPVLRWLSGEGPEPEQIEVIYWTRIWVQAAVTALGDDPRFLAVHDRAISLLGSLSDALARREPEATRSALLRTLIPDLSTFDPESFEARFLSKRVTNFEAIEALAHEISQRIEPSEELEDTRHTIRYVLVELLRNTIQHSQSPIGGFVVADLANVEQRREMVQVAVVDLGIGIPASLRAHHPKLTDAGEALEKSLWPHFSGTFEEGLTGTQQNAGMGLFFISEMAKLTGGNLLIATRGATLLLSGFTDEEGGHTLRFVEPHGTGFPGTLVVFELPVGSVVDYPALIETIKERAKQRTPARVTSRWLRFDLAPAGTTTIEVRTRAEDTPAAIRTAQEELTPRILRREPVTLDFAGLSIVTQSFVHSLLFEPLRLAWALRTPIYVENVEPAVKSTLELLENYALAG